MKPTFAWIEMAACSGCGVSFLDNYNKVLDVLKKFDMKYYTMLMDERNLPEKMDIAVVEGACTVTNGQIELLRDIRRRTKTLVALGSCASTGGVLSYASGNQMPMPELDAYLPINDVVTVDYAIPGCPPSPEVISKFLLAYVGNDKKYLVPYHDTIGKCGGKIRDIVKMGLCASCGMCGATCPTNAIEFIEGKPVIRDERCIICGECYFQCLRSFLCFDIIRKRLSEEESIEDKAIGMYKEIVALRATSHETRRAGQCGGTVTSLFAYALDNRILDGVIVNKKSEENIWFGDPIIVTKTDDLLTTAGTKYSVCPILSPLKKAVTAYGLRKLGIVGLACHHQSLQKLFDYPAGIRHIGDKIALQIGLFCTSNFRYNAMTKMVEEVGGIRPEDVHKIDIGAGNFVIYSVTGEEIEVPLKVVHDYEQESCKICPDFTAEFADISVGSVGSPDTWSTVIVRTERGKRVIEGAIAEGYVQSKEVDEESINLIKKISETKRKRGNRYIEKRKEYGLLVPFF
ncbi:MAG: Coenzyme F420 hydrogenase/dehydrogenase, beta subunit C-terminal domain [Candidatus Methanofastidiosia archaeon]